MKLTHRQNKVYNFLKLVGRKKASTMDIQSVCQVCSVAKIIYELRDVGVKIPPAEYAGKSANGNRIFFYWLEAK